MQSARLLTRDEAPPLLWEIQDPPKKLWLRGSLPKPNTKYLTVVGSRNYSQYGKEVCEHLISGLAGYPISIVSGLALGIDGIAHRAALRAGLHTVAVPGSGLEDTVLYPRSHVFLAREILNGGGALLSEFEPTMRATPYTFPQRNRIMAGMADAVLLVEASEKSGTLITARLTSDYNRELLIVPGSIFSANTKGAHQFLRLGATLVTESNHILEALHIDPNNGESSEAKLQSLTSDERKIVDLLLLEPMERELLISQLGIPAQNANILLSMMEIKGLIIESAGKVRLLS